MDVLFSAAQHLIAFRSLIETVLCYIFKTLSLFFQMAAAHTPRKVGVQSLRLIVSLFLWRFCEYVQARSLVALTDSQTKL